MSRFAPKTFFTAMGRLCIRPRLPASNLACGYCALYMSFLFCMHACACANSRRVAKLQRSQPALISPQLPRPAVQKLLNHAAPWCRICPSWCRKSICSSWSIKFVLQLCRRRPLPCRLNSTPLRSTTKAFVAGNVPDSRKHPGVDDFFLLLGIRLQLVLLMEAGSLQPGRIPDFDAELKP